MGARRKSRTNHLPLTLAIVGDVMLGRLMNDAMRVYGPVHPWGNTVDLLQNADLTLINLECVIASDGTPWTRTPKVFHFRADPEAIEVLEAVDVDYVSLANNHTLDFEESAMLEMLHRLDAVGIAHAGAGRNLKDARQPAWLRVKNKNIAVISFTDNEPDWAATATSPGVNFVPISRAGRQFSHLLGDIRKARVDGADIVVVSAHWGPNMRERPSPEQIVFAHELIDAGCDIFHGHSAHIFQGIEIYKGKPIFFDTGDFVDDYYVDRELRNDQSAIFKLQMDGNTTIQIDVFPTTINNFQVNLANRSDFEAIAERMRRLSGEMGTEVVIAERQLMVASSPSAMPHLPKAS